MVGRLDETVYFHWFVLFQHTFSVVIGEGMHSNKKSYLNFRISGKKGAVSTDVTDIVCMAWFPITEHYN